MHNVPVKRTKPNKKSFPQLTSTCLVVENMWSLQSFFDVFCRDQIPFAWVRLPLHIVSRVCPPAGHCLTPLGFHRHLQSIQSGSCIAIHQVGQQLQGLLVHTHYTSVHRENKSAACCLTSQSHANCIVGDCTRCIIGQSALAAVHTVS